MRIEICTIGNFEFESKELNDFEIATIQNSLDSEKWVEIPVHGYPIDRSISIKVSNIVTFEKIGK